MNENPPAQDPVGALLARQCARYPRLETSDLVKALYQSELGCGHFVADDSEGLRRLIDEAEASPRAQREREPPFIEPLGARFSRVHLPRLRENGLSPRTLFRLFVLSGETRGDPQALERALKRLEALIDQGALPLDASDARAFLAAYRRAGCPATHHSEAFRRAYAPAYRVVASEHCRVMPVLCGVDRLMARQGRATVAIDGDSASGKTSLAALLASLYDCNVFHMDDFFLRPCQRTPERFAQPGGNVDRERFQTEVLDPVARGEAFAYRPFDCRAMRLGGAVCVEPKPLNIVEGAYSMHPALEKAYDLSVFLSADAESQADRILRRNGAEMLERFQREWIPLEKRYFQETNAAGRCQIRLPGDEEGAGRP